jgi:DNA polymerase III epsilon subunit-like protein
MSSSITERIYFYDLETTALEINKACILECYIQNWDGTRKKHWYIYPSDHRPITNSHIHNITLEKLEREGAVNIEQFVNEFTYFLNNREENNRMVNIVNNEDMNPFVPINKIYLIAHNNNRYDKLVLIEEFRRLGRQLPEQWNFRDSLVHFRRLYPNIGYGKYKLSLLYERFQEECESSSDLIEWRKINTTNQLHSATYDTILMVCLYKRKIYERYQNIDQFIYFFENTL